MLKYLKKYWHFCLLAPLFMLGEIAMDLIQPDMMATIVDEGVLKGDLQLVLYEGIRMILLVFFGGFCGVMCGVFANLASQQFGNDLRKDLFAKVMSLSFEQTDHFSTGSLVTRLVNDVTQVQQMVAMSMRGVVRNSVMFVGGIIMLYLQSPRFALVAACGLPFILFFVVFFLKKASPLFAIVQKRLDGVNNCVQETIAGARVVKAYVREDHELERFDAANDALCDTNLRVQSLLAFMMPCMNIVLNLCVTAILYVGGYTIRTTGDITSGRIMAAITYMAMILHGVTFMANIFQTFTRAGASVNRINEVLRCGNSLPDGPATPPSPEGELEFRHVSFAYPGGDQNVLEDISLCVHKGETLGIIGSTGSGKSTLANLIPRFYDVTEGQILVDGTDVKDYPLSKLRKRISIVMQKAELYSRSIESNIRWGREEASPEDIRRAASIAQADDFIRLTADGYDTPVTEGGHSLSGGQKQRIAISRAVLKDARILIFDDATNALDLQTESRLYQALQKECPDVTKVIIAQRIASIRNADRIAVLEGGRLAACGTHEELLAGSQIYRDIYDSQLKQ
ncbi:MAG: ABC transporter ATP-binding protein/permease [Clostridium sp.]|nr:ABC transporter ATP-binding protein/permease [Acetatifactor muris]MCM1562975.1 ABC transporter ATP-binding protein/permease [Clostridium sp.]